MYKKIVGEGNMFIKGITEFFTHIIDAAFICRQIAVSVSMSVVLGDCNIFKPTPKGIFTLAWQAALMFVVLLTLNMLLFAFSFSTKILRGLNFSLSTMLSVVIYALIFCKYKPRPRIVLAAVVAAAAITLEDFGGLFGRSLCLVIPSFDSAVTKIFSAVMLCGFAVLIRRFSVAELGVSVFDLVLNLTVMFVAVFGIVFYDAVSVKWFFGADDYVRMYISVMFLMVFAVDVAAYITTYCLCKDRQTIILQRAESQKQLAELETVRLSEKHFKELREIRHDLKNKYAYMTGMLQAGETEKLKKYFEKMNSELKEALGSYFDCGNSEVNAIVNLERTKAASAGVEMETDIVVPKELPFVETDLVSIMTNIIDNAIEECSRIKRDRKTVTVSMSTVGGSTYICVTNPTDKPKKAVSGRMATVKGDKELHGLGMDIISRLTAKYGGYFRCKIEDGIFSAEALLNDAA